MTSPHVASHWRPAATNATVTKARRADSPPEATPGTALDNVTLCSANAARIAYFRPKARPFRISEAKIRISLPLSTIAKSLHPKEKNFSPPTPPKALFPPPESHPVERNKHC